MGILLLVAIVLFLIIHGSIRASEANEPTLDNGLKKKYFIWRDLEYVGGIDGIYDLTKVNISMSNDNILAIDFDGKYKNYNKRIRMGDIQSVIIQTEEQIKNDVTLGRLVMFGVFALAMKKEKRYMEKYLIINYLGNGQEQQIISRGQGAIVIKEYYEKIKKGEVDYRTGQVRV